MQTKYIYLAVNSNLRYLLSELYVSLVVLGTNFIEKDDCRSVLFSCTEGALHAS